MPERRRIERLRRLEKVRAIARQSAATEAAQAEGTLAQLQALAGRTAALAQDYAARAHVRDGHDLAALARFTGQLEGVRAATHADARAAELRADAAQRSLAQAERRRAAVEARADSAARALEARSAHAAAGARKAIGTGLETDRA